MKALLKLSFFYTACLTSAWLAGCSDKNNDDPVICPDGDATIVIGFKDAPTNLFASSAYGENIYNGQISKGYFAQLNDDTYAQFPINYGLNYNENFEMTWCYTIYNGGLVLSDYHDMIGDTYTNQLSVYDTTSPSGGNFIVANGSSLISDPDKAVYSDYDDCGRIYITDENGYSVSNIGEQGIVSGTPRQAWFKSLWINNTTYTFLTIKNGNEFTQPLNEENKGWFKVQFIAFKDDDPKGKPEGYTEVYLANFDRNLADGYIGIIDEWIEVDLSSLNQSSILVINFVGSDSGEWGLNTPAYCALDNISIVI